MTFDEFHRGLEGAAAKLADEINYEISRDVESAALRFVDGNFATQGWEGVPWKPSTGTILVKTGTLRSGFRSEITPGQIRIFNAVAYGEIHNEGFDGIEKVRKHSRRSYPGKKGKLKAGKTSEVRAHTRHMKMPKRQFAPYEGHESPTLNREVDQIIDEKIVELLNGIKKR